MQKLPKPSLSCGNSTCPKTPQSGFLEEAKAVPAESIRPDRSRTAAKAHVLAKQYALTSQFISTASIKSNNSFLWGRVTANVSDGMSKRSHSPKTYVNSKNTKRCS